MFAVTQPTGTIVTSEYCSSSSSRRVELVELSRLIVRLSRFPSNKHIAHVRSDKGTSNLYFHWNPVAYPDGVAGYIDALPSPPTHIFFAAHLWFTRRNSTPEHYVESVRPFLKRLEQVAPRAKIVTRTSSSAVQALVSR